MKRYISKIKDLAFSSTAKDTYILFSGNLFSAFWGFVFTIILSNYLDRDNFGIFSAALNLVVILTSLSDIGITSGLINFISSAESRGDTKESEEYEKAGLNLRVFVSLMLSLFVFIFSKKIATSMLATNDPIVSVWVGIISIVLVVPLYFPYILQAKKKFIKSIIVDNLYYIFRLASLLGFVYTGYLTLYTSFSTALFGFVISLFFAFLFIGTKFLKSKPSKSRYLSLLKFSGWLGVNRIVSSISGRLDIQMLASLAGASITALYSIPSRLASFLIVLASSFSGVLATRMARFGNKEEERKYIIKSTFALIPIILIVIVWAILAYPTIYILFPKYLDSVDVFRSLILSNIPFILTVPSVTAIIYGMKKNVYIGVFSFVQLGLIFILNLYLIPKFGAMGPTYTYMVTNSILAIYTWFVVIKHYWFSK